MRARYRALMQTPSVEAAQLESYGKVGRLPPVGEGEGALGGDEIGFIVSRDSFYLASVSETGWPYVQHRGGPKGFLRVVDQRTVAFVDLAGNRQLISAGNILANGRVSLFLMNYVGRERLKLTGLARRGKASGFSRAVDKLGLSAAEAAEAWLVVIEVLGFDYNCPKHITPRYSRDEIEEAYGRRE